MREKGPWLAGLQRSIPGRSRHSRLAAAAKASLPSLTVPLWVRLGWAPCRVRRIDPLGARPLPERTSEDRWDLASATLATSPRSLPVPLAGMFAYQRDTPFSLDDKTRSVPPLRGTPRIAPVPRRRNFSLRSTGEGVPTKTPGETPAVKFAATKPPGLALPSGSGRPPPRRRRRSSRRRSCRCGRR